jgi:hypothetical protein
MNDTNIIITTLAKAATFHRHFDDTPSESTEFDRAQLLVGIFLALTGTTAEEADDKHELVRLLTESGFSEKVIRLVGEDFPYIY